ncbi:choice-of-anchor A domain-containing protein [Propionibacterium cyclohexanicum]|uniref:Choice-of-anchor A domain-containing protein n=1 Tax=Propionibacterium cyclohexanicum TaxID=64702 RepID=A0A1H9SR70_9ACTN|nr:choice-of-anchor A family protein [Propionibacterium cyclohexanicum]SER87305.1 choice-of-anchor A domain-containing protein [Propionibacterium cyclohexanicum]
MTLRFSHIGRKLLTSLVAGGLIAPALVVAGGAAPAFAAPDECPPPGLMPAVDNDGINGIATEPGGAIISGAQRQRLGANQALDPFGDFDQRLQNESRTLMAVEPTGMMRNPWGGRFEPLGDGVSSLQVFMLTAAQASAVTEIDFANVPGNTPILINITGGPVTMSGLSWVPIDGVRVDDPASSSTALGNAASRIAWNFATATAVAITGSSQFVGAILAPEAGTTEAR